MAITATDMMRRIDIRRRRVDSLVAKVFYALRDYIPDEHLHEAHRALIDLFHEQGAEVLTDYDRQLAGLPPRGPDGWTDEELMALEAVRLELLTKPLRMTIP